ncbi:MAG: peptidoglycan DD-metalloendopeptidase family protein [Gammaproteobacteria bacterium]|nr:peptidoglycan DD-metalloendopeptidase family protein [Gammaproteobacteria bacterium]
MGGATARLSLVLAMGVALAVQAKDEHQEKTEQLKQLRGRIEALQQSLNETRGERDQARVQLREVERDIGRLINEQKQLQIQLKIEAGKLQALQTRERTARAELRAHTDSLASQVRAAYAMGEQEYLKLLLNQQDPASVARVHVYYRYLTQARSARMDEIRASLAQLAALEKQITERARELTALRAEQARQQQALQETRARRGTILAGLNQKLSSQSQTIERLKRDEQGLARLLRELSQALAATPNLPGPVGPGARFQDFHGKLSLPVKGRILARYGDPKNVGDIRWKGLFLAAQEGRDVTAVFRGRVAYADWLRGFGLLIILEHGDGYMTLYGHNQNLTKAVGDWVEAGQVIASVGNTGGNPQSGLYFEIRHQGEPRNPLQWCRTP